MLVKPNGRAFNPPPVDTQIRKWRFGTLPKCDAVGFCEGMKHILRDCASEKLGRITAVGEFDAAGQGNPDAIGFLNTSHNHLLLFNFCPACGGKLKLQANQGV